MSADQFTNFAISTLAGGGSGPGGALLSGDTTLIVSAGTGALFPATTAGTFRAILLAPSNLPEIVICTARTTDTLTITRAQENTTAPTSWPLGSTVLHNITAGNMSDLWAAANGGGAVFAVFNVTTYGAKCDGATDDTAAWLAALAAANAAGGGVVYHPGGVSRTSASLVLPGDNIILRGAGFGSVIKPLSGATFDVISTPIPASSGAAGYTRNYCGVEQLKLDCSAMTGTVAGQGNGIHFYGERYGFIRDVFITGCPNYCIVLDGDITANFGYNTEIHRCIFDVCAAGILVYGCEAHDIVQNLFKFATTACAAAQPAFNSPSTTARHLTLNGGYVFVSGNVFGNGGSYTTEAVLITNGGPCRIVGNRFDTVLCEAIHTTAGSHVIEGNAFTSCGSANTGKATVSLGSAGNIVKGNEWDNTNGTTHSSYCVQENGAYTSNIIEGNVFVTGASGVVSLNASTAATVKNNVGYNPRGPLTAPGIPASATAYTHHFGGDCTVFVIGGTVTGIAIGGTATGVTSGAVRVPAGQTITLTYSASPSWAWFGD